MILIAFHFGTLLFLDIVFPLHVLINALLFVMSPVAPGGANWRAMFAAVPVLGLRRQDERQEQVRGGVGHDVSFRS
jgi:hypothetical protein